MKNFICRPLYLPFVLVLAAVLWPVFLPCPWLFIPLSLLLVWGYYAIDRHANPMGIPRIPLIIIFLTVSLLLSFLVFLRVNVRINKFNSVAANSGFSRQQQLFMATVIGFPEGFYDSWSLPIVLDQVIDGRSAISSLTPGTHLSLRLPPTSYNNHRLPLIGDRITVKAKVRGYRSPKHPFLASRRYRWMVSDSRFFAEVGQWNNLTIDSGQHRFFIMRPIDELRRWLYGQIHKNTQTENVAGILKALLLGTRDSLSPEMKDLFLDFGIYHLFAISGLHVGIVVSVIFFSTIWLLNWLIPHFFIAGPRKSAAVIALLFGWLYVLMTGMHLPAVRAGIMASIFLLAIMLDMAEDPFAALMMAIIVILIMWPQSLFQLSFQLSVAAVAAILLAVAGFQRIAPRMKSFILPGMDGSQKWLYTMLYRGFIVMLIGTSAWLATMPLLLNCFHYLTPFSLLSNLFLVPLFSLIVLPFGVLVLVVLPVPGVGFVGIQLLSWLMSIIITSCQWLHALVPKFRWYYPSLSGLEMILFYGFWLLLGSAIIRRRKSLPVTGLLLILILSVGDWIYWQDRREHRDYLTISCFAGGNIQSAIIEIPGGDVVLLNGGGYPKSRFSMARQVITPYCCSEKISHIKTLILTKPQNGSVAGLDYMVQNFGIREIWYNGIWTGYPPFREFYQWTREHGVRWRKLTDLSRPRYFNQLEITVINPLANDLPPIKPWKKFLQEMSLSLKIIFGKSRIILWGGTESGAGDWLSTHTLELDELEALICIRPLTKSSAFSLSDLAIPPQIVVGPRCDFDSTGEERLTDSIFWTTRENGFLHLDMYPDGHMIINNKN
ncbi:MAG: hypothetical protein GWP07_00220 [Xanthomonadaceae bacterium]|nr:hypothetical protein [Xanthomonadaceae bacterium]